MSDEIKPFAHLNKTTCLGCGRGWTFMGTGYCGPCLEKIDQIPEPIPMKDGGLDDKPTVY